MANIAIIDDWIDSGKLEQSVPIRYISAQNKEITVSKKGDRYTHATIIAKVLEKCAIDYTLMSSSAASPPGRACITGCSDEYTILNIVLTYKLDEPRNISELEQALSICLREPVDIVCMSLGTTWVSEGKYIRELIRRLYDKGVIMIAAVDNEGFYMIPAAMPEVIGVGLDREGKVPPGEHIYRQNSLLNANVSVNCDLDIPLKNTEFYPSTSFAVPVIAAKVNNYLNKGERGFAEILEQLREHAAKIEIEEEYGEKGNEAECTLPVVSSDNLAVDEWVQIMNVMIEKYKVEPIGVDSRGSIKDYRFLDAEVYWPASSLKVLSFVEMHTTADIIFVSADADIMESDIKVKRLDGKYLCLVNETKAERYCESIPDLCEYIVNTLA